MHWRREIVCRNFFAIKKSEFSFRSPVLRKALCTVDGPPLSGLKRDLSLFPAIRTSGFVHYSWRSKVAAPTAFAPISRSVSVASPIAITHSKYASTKLLYSRTIKAFYRSAFDVRWRFPNSWILKKRHFHRGANQTNLLKERSREVEVTIRFLTKIGSH
jgi:hypothetical protein